MYEGSMDESNDCIRPSTPNVTVSGPLGVWSKVPVAVRLEYPRTELNRIIPWARILANV